MITADFNGYHLLWILFLVVFFCLSFWIKKGIMWLITLGVDILLAYLAITQGWEALVFPPILGIFIISIMGFIHDTLEEGRLV